MQALNLIKMAQKARKIKDVMFGLYAAEELTAADGTTIPADGLIEVIFLDENGHGRVISDLTMGSYYVQEISTNSAYLVSDEKYPVDFAYAGQETAVVTITANEGESIKNKLIYGSVSGRKSNEDGEDLGGAVIGIFKVAPAHVQTEVPPTLSFVIEYRRVHKVKGVRLCRKLVDAVADSRY